MSSNPLDKPVVAVCGSEARVYGPIDAKTSRREFLYQRDFPHHGAALLFAQEYEDDKPRQKA